MEKQVTIKNTLSDITINDMYKLSIINFNTTLTEFEKNIEVLYILGAEDVDDIPIDVFKELVSSIDLNINDSYKPQSVVQLPKLTLKLKGEADDFKFSVKQILSIKKHMDKSNLQYVHKLIKEVYSIDVLEPVGDMDDYLKDNITMDIAAPFINILLNKYK
jgi:hypothetical protein